MNQRDLELGFAPDAWDVSFDVFQRCAATAHLMREMCGKDDKTPRRILDVGAGRSPFLSRFLPSSGYEAFFLDRELPAPSEQEGRGWFVTGDALALPFPDECFDCVSCVDVLEHLDVSDRLKALDEMVRVSQGRLLVAVPCMEDGVRLHEEAVNSAFRAYHGTGHPRLDEHLRQPLPSERDLRDYLASEYGLEGQSFPNGYLPRWQEMIAFSLMLYRVPELREFAALVNRFYNRELYGYDGKGPAYRRIIAFGADRQLLLQCRREDAPYQRSYAQLQAYLRIGYHLLTLAGSRRVAHERQVKEAELASLRTAISNLTEEKALRDSEIVSLRSELKGLQGSNSALQARIGELLKELGQLRTTASEREQEFQALRHELECIAGEIRLVEASERWAIGGAVVNLYRRLLLRRTGPDMLARIAAILDGILAEDGGEEKPTSSN